MPGVLFWKGELNGLASQWAYSCMPPAHLSNSSFHSVFCDQRFAPVENLAKIWIPIKIHQKPTKICGHRFPTKLGGCIFSWENGMKSSRIQSLRVSHLFSIRLMGWSMHCQKLHLWGKIWKGVDKIAIVWEWLTKTLEICPSFTSTQSPKQNAGILKLWLREYEHRVFLALFWKNYMTTWAKTKGCLKHHRSVTSTTWHKLPRIIWLRHLAEIILPTLGTEFATPTLLLKPDMAIKNESLHSQKLPGSLHQNYISSNLQCWRGWRVASQYGQVLQGC